MVITLIETEDSKVIYRMIAFCIERALLLVRVCRSRGRCLSVYYGRLCI